MEELLGNPDILSEIYRFMSPGRIVSFSFSNASREVVRKFTYKRLFIKGQPNLFTEWRSEMAEINTERLNFVPGDHKRLVINISVNDDILTFLLSTKVNKINIMNWISGEHLTIKEDSLKVRGSFLPREEITYLCKVRHIKIFSGIYYDYSFLRETDVEEVRDFFSGAYLPKNIKRVILAGSGDIGKLKDVIEVYGYSPRSCYEETREIFPNAKVIYLSEIHSRMSEESVHLKSLMERDPRIKTKEL